MAENSTSLRVVGRPWPKGVSGNPGGIPKGTPGLIERARRLALSFAPKAIKTLGDLLDHEDARVRVSAAEGLLDRAGLRPYSLEPERIEVAATVDADALRSLLAARLSRLVGDQVVEALPAAPERELAGPASATSGEQSQ